MPRKKSARRAVVTCPRCGFDADPSAGPLNFCPGCGAGLREGPGGPGATGAFASRVIADRYRLRELIGEGGMGAVYKAEHIRMGKALALKILRGDFAREPGAVERFLAEARIVSRLSHPHTIAVFDFGEVDEDGSGFYLAMEYVPGMDLAAVLRESGRLPERRVADIGQQILGSLAEAHDAGIVHRDVKPGNVMLMRTRSGEDFVKVLDFGIAKLRDGRTEGASTADKGSVATTSTGAIVGTPNYLAPEQARAEPIDGRSDLYAVGCLLYELAAGKPPFVAPSPIAVVAAHLHQEPAPLGQQAPGISRAFADVVHRALRKRAAERFASADEMRAALHALSQPSRARRAGPRRPAITGELRIASREDFAEIDRFRALRQGRVLAPVLALLVAAGVGLAWRWGDAYSFLASRAERLASAIPPSLRPNGLSEGSEQEPNDAPARANPLVLPPGPDGRAGAGTALVRGHLGAKLSDNVGDVDVYRVEVPAVDGTKVLVAEWHAEGAAEGIRGLDVVLALNRELDPGDRRPSAPLVASADRGGPGRAEALVAAVGQGAYYLSVREQHDEATGPVEKPTDRYVLEVRLSDPRPGEEVEPNDGPDRTRDGHERYPHWRAAAERNPLAAGAPLRGLTGPDDPDLYAIEPRGAAAPVLVAAVPEPGLALVARLWRPDTEDLLSEAAQDRIRFEDGGDASAGRILAVKLDGAAREGAPALVELRAQAGQGGYEVVALGRDAASGAAVLALSRALADAGRTVSALELAAAFAGSIPEAPGRSDVLHLAAEIAARAAPNLAPDTVGAYDRAAQLLGAAIFEVLAGKVVYRGAFGPAPSDAPPLPTGAATTSR